MSSEIATLAAGTRLEHDGEVYTVAVLEGTRVTLRSALGRSLQADVGWLLAHGSTRLLVPQPPGAEGAGAALAALTSEEAAAVRLRAAHIREVLTGYRSGDPAAAAPGEPRADYDPSRLLMARYAAKAAELGIGVSTLRRWAQRLQESGPVGLVDRRARRPRDPLRGIDQRWVDACMTVVAGHVDASRPTADLVLRRIDARLDERWGPGTPPRPGPKRARRALAELTRGTNALAGSTKGKRSIANRPRGVYGRLRAVRPGEYLLLDTNALDVFAMEALTLRWVPLELTVALDLCTRCVAGLRLSPLSTKAVDAALVVYEALIPGSAFPTSSGIMPYHGVPTAIVVDPDRLVPTPAGAGLPGVAPESVVVDHGKIYLSEHLLSVCARLGISVEPARPYTPTDKAAIERFFRTLSEQLLAALPGYKGPDVHGRGRDVEAQTYFFVHELEGVIREWVATIYHRRPHDGLVDPAVPGLRYSPLEMFERGVAQSGRLLVPARPDLAYDFLPVAWRTIQHYGVDLHGLRYNGPALTPYRSRTSPYGGVRAGKWPLRYDPDDVSRVFFQDPNDHTWHTVRWEHAQDVPDPFSADALAYARRLAAERDRFPDDRRALADLLERWDAGLTRNPSERRMALRLSAQRAARLEQHKAEAADDVRGLATVRALFGEGGQGPGEEGAGPDVPGGDDDTESELVAGASDEPAGPPDVSDEEFYAEAFATVE